MAGIKQSKKFKALVALLNGDEKAAIQQWNIIEPTKAIPVEAEVDPRVAELVKAGFTQEQAEHAVGLTTATPVPSTQPTQSAQAVAVPLTSKETADGLVAKAGLVHTRGRVYVTPEIIEAQVRVFKTGKPEIVKNGGNHHTKAVVLFRTDDESAVAVQNLGQPN